MLAVLTFATHGVGDSKCLIEEPRSGGACVRILVWCFEKCFPTTYIIWSSRLLIPSQNMRNNFIYIYIYFFSHSLLLVFSSFWKLSQISCTLFFNELLFTAFFCPIPILWIERWSPWVLKAHRNRKDLGIPDSSHWGSRESHLKVETQIEQMMEGGIYRE